MNYEWYNAPKLAEAEYRLRLVRAEEEQRQQAQLRELRLSRRVERKLRQARRAGLSPEKLRAVVQRALRGRASSL